MKTSLQHILRLLMVAIVLMSAFSLLGVVVDIAQTLLGISLRMLVLLLVVFIVLGVVNGVLNRKK
ncbi:MAG TPA: hypothetical protein PLL64_12060 [Rhodothermales bacterium]|nr:hypothetical protein [Rhodothermales bacterium]HRR09931.1 hypothetical protein [Rhodothermales bacterium]